ncbi:MAG: DMT family transporter [Candidatus Micrarchaeaceae archaeon]
MKIKNKAYIAIGIAMVELAVTPVLLAVSGYGASGHAVLSNTLSLLFYVFLVGSVSSLAISYAKDRMQGLFSIFKNTNMLVLLIVAGLFNDAISQALLGIGSIGTNPGIGAIVFRTWIIMVAILMPLVLRNKVTKIQLLATMFGLAGAYVIVSNGTLLTINMQELPYVAILLLAALAVTFSTLIMKKYNADTMGTIALFNISSAMFLGIFMLFFNHASAFAFTPTTVFTIFFLGIAAYAVGTTLYYYSLRVLGPMVIGNIILVVPFLTIFISWLAIGTAIKPYYFIAAALLSVGIVVQQRFSKAPEHIKSKAGAPGMTIFDISGVFADTKSQAISSSMMGDRRALCIKLNGAMDYDRINQVSGKYGCLAFTTDRLHEEVTGDELEFIKDITGLNNGETALVGVGKADMIEQTFKELHGNMQYGAEDSNIYTKSE